MIFIKEGFYDLEKPVITINCAGELPDQYTVDSGHPAGLLRAGWPVYAALGAWEGCLDDQYGLVLGIGHSCDDQ